MKSCHTNPIFAYFEHLSNMSCNKIHRFRKTLRNNSFVFQIQTINPFWIQLVYLISISFIGYFALKITNPTTSSINPPNDLDIFFTSVSSATVSSMATLDLQIFSNTQLIIITILMLTGGEVFISMLSLLFQRSKPRPSNDLQLSTFSGFDQKPENDMENNTVISCDCPYNDHSIIKSAALKLLGYVVLGYFVVVNVSGSIFVAIYAYLATSARHVLAKRGINLATFSIFVAISTFANCGFVPTSENMMAFKGNPGLLLILIPQILLGNCLYGPCLRFVIWVLEKSTKRVEFSYMLRSWREMGYSHLMSSVRCWFVVVTVVGFMGLQLTVFCCLEWNSPLMDGLSCYEKIVGVLFQVVNSRHAGESVFDLSAVSPAILVVFIVMMYLPPYASYLPQNEEELEVDYRKGKETTRKKIVECVLFSQLSYLVIFIFLICVVERENIKNDPLNFNVFNITFEVISAYGNVGFSTGYSCERQIKPGSNCKDAWIGFVGKWSNFAKCILILVMFFGRIKKFNKNGGKAWKLS